jgi:hypothetical protein
LSAAKAAVVYPAKLREWKETSTVSMELIIDGIDHAVSLISYPELHADTNEIICKCLDGDHLLVNLRSKVCKDGVHDICRDAWIEVAEKTNVISQSLVVDLIDKQNNAYAQKTFSEEVENEMKARGHLKEAKFCGLIRRWYQAEDDRGLSAIERAKYRIDLHEFLLNGVSFSSFPPHGAFIKGFPTTMFEGFVQSIENHLFLYALCRSGTYNQRSFSTLENETFFGVLSDMEPTSLGCPKATSVDRLLSVAAEILHYKQDPTTRYGIHLIAVSLKCHIGYFRTFGMRTTRNTVYPARKLESPTHHLLNDTAEIMPVTSIGQISIR